MYNYKLELQMVNSEYFLIKSVFFPCILQVGKNNGFLVLVIGFLDEYIWDIPIMICTVIG